MVNIKGLDRADVLRALYDAAKPQELGFLHFTPDPMTKQEAAGLLEQSSYFEYVKGRVLKVKLAEGASEFDPWLYDRVNGPGAAERAVSALRA